jgi:hypothetical protein
MIKSAPEQKLTGISTLYLQPTTIIPPDDSMLSCQGVERSLAVVGICNQQSMHFRLT